MIVNIKDMGAIGDGAFLNTEAIQKAIDLCSQSGGGTVLIEDGVYITGKISQGQIRELLPAYYANFP